MESGQIDNLFLGILQNCGQIEPFVDIIFSFLARRTDFFRIMHNKDDKMGFPEGVAEKMILRIFKKYQSMVLGSAEVNKDKKTAKTKSKTKEKVDTSSDTLQPKQEKQQEQEHHKLEKDKAESVPENVNAGPTVVASTVEVTSSDVEQPVSSEHPCSSSEVQDIEPDTSNAASNDSASSKITSSDQSSESQSKLLEPGKLPECYNGAILDKYTWSQTIKDIDMKIPVPQCVRRARDLTVEIKSSSLKVCLKGNIPPEELTTGSNVLVDGELQRTVKCEESMWSLEPGKCVQINLEKTEERFWTAVYKGDPEIDRTKVDSTRNIEDFDEQTQTDFQQVMYDHHQKMMGKPTSKEQKTNELLAKAWNAKGSPFAGTPFDPSKVNISS